MANGFPRFVIVTCSPSFTHADILEKRFLRSATDAVFMIHNIS